MPIAPARPLRALAALAAAATLASAAHATAPRHPAAPAVAEVACDGLAGTLVGTDSLALPIGAELVQPLPQLDNIAAIEPGVRAVQYSDGMLRLDEWDPAALAPDPTGTMLRSFTFLTSNVNNSWMSITLDPPFVARALPHVADPLRTLAWRWSNIGYVSHFAQPTYFNASGDAAWPVAYSVTTSATPLPGPHPVLCQEVCLAADPLKDLRVGQSVAHYNTTYDYTWETFALRFRVPQALDLRWVELPIGNVTSALPYFPGTIAIFDADGQSTPPMGQGTELVQANFTATTTGAQRWVKHFDFDAVVTLQPQHDYWLFVRTQHNAELRAWAATGNEGPDYAAGIGELWARHQYTDAWSPQPGKAIGFRLIGVPASAVDAPAAPRLLAFTVSPNPVRDALTLQWSDVRGRLRVEVLDVRGRRIAGEVLDSQGAGTWRWRAMDAQGRPLPAGAYFVRAVDDAGHAGMRRVVLVR